MINLSIDLRSICLKTLAAFAALCLWLASLASAQTTASVQAGFTLSATSPTTNPVTPTTYIAYGDSITFGTGASSEATQYTNLLAADLSATLTNRGVSGRQACDVAQIIMSNDNPPASLAPLQTIMVGTNDAFWDGSGAYEAVYKACHSASLAWLAIPSTQKTPAQSCTQTGLWQPDNTYVSGVAAQSYSPGATLSCPITSYGGPIYMWYRVTDTNLGAFLYSVDNGPAQSANSFSNPPIATWSGGIDGVFLIRIPGLPAGSHTVQVTVTAASVSILAVGSLNPTAQIGAPQVFAGGVIRFQNDNSPTVSAAYDSDAAADVALLSGDGLPVYFVPVRNFVNAYSDMSDGFHPNDTGHMHLRDAYESLSQYPLNSPASFSSTVTVMPANGFSSAVTLSASGWPAGITGKFSTNPVTKSTTVNISVAASVAPGPYVLTVNGTGGGTSASTTIPLTVPAFPSFSLSATAVSATAVTPGTSTLKVTPINGFVPAVEFSPAGWPSGITATFSPGLTTTSATATISVTGSVAPGLYNLTLKGSAGSFSATTTLALTVTAIPGISSSATFSTIDTSTQGTWSGTYGSDGYLIAGDANSPPGYAGVNFTVTTSTYTWAPSTTDVRGLQISPGSTNRIAAAYLLTGSGNLTFNLNLTDGAAHQVALYFLDWDSNTSLQTVSIADSLTGIILDNRTVSQFNSGVYVVWTIKGNVTVNVTANGAGGPLLSAIFFGHPVTAPVISNVSVSNITTTAATITWNTDQASNSSVTYGTSSTGPDSSYVTTHSVTLTNLTPGTTYNFSVTSTNAAALSTTSPVSSFTTTPSVTSTPPYVGYVAAWGINGSGATVTWSTDVLADTQLNYGTTPNLGTLTPVQSTPVISHGVILTGLSSGTTYYFQAQSKGANGATGYSTTYTFTTTGTAAAPAPVITNVSVTNITTTSVTVNWTTDQAATTQVNYGTTTAYGSSSVLNSSLITSHSVVLSGLTPGTTYDYDVVSTNSSGTSSGMSTNYTFQTAAIVATPTVISSIQTSVTSTTATITWKTDQASNSAVNYGTTSTTPDSNYVTSHLVTLTGLTPGTTYNFSVVSTIAAGLTTTSPTNSFTTTAANATPPFVGYVAFWGINNSGVTISWSTDVLANTQLNYGTTPSLGTLSPLQSQLTASHGVVLTNLASGTTYYFVAQSTGANGATGYSATYSFTTTGTPSAPAPNISNIQSAVTANSATISWTTDEAASAQVNYGVTAAYSASSTLNPALTTSHTVTLTGLMPGTLYDFDVVSSNSNGLAATSANATFQTSGSAPGPVITSVGASSITSSTALITWVTDQAASSLVNYGSQTASSPGNVTDHSVTLTGLTPNTQYSITVTSANAVGVSTTSNPVTFTTAKESGNGPVISYLAFWGVTSSGVTISWSTDIPGTTAVNYGTTNSLGTLSPLQTALTNSHGVVLTGLLPGTTYYFQAQSADVNGNTGYSATIYTFTTQGSSGPTISNVVAHASAGNTATISWTTSVPTYSYVQYGTSAGNYIRYSAQTTLTNSPNCTLGYVPSGTVHYQLVSTDANGNQATSPDATFVEP